MQYISDLEYDFTTASSWSETVTIPTGARKAVVTFHTEGSTPPTVSSITLDGVSLAQADDGSTQGAQTQSTQRTEVWEADLTAGNEGAGKTFAGSMSGAASVKTRVSLAFIDAQGNVSEVQVFGGTVNTITFSAMNFTAPAIAIMAWTANANFDYKTTGSLGTGQVAYFDQANAGDAAALATYEEFSSGTSDDQTYDADGAGTRTVAAVCVAFSELAAAVERKLGYGGFANTAGARDFSGKAAAQAPPGLPPTGGKIDLISQHQIDTTIDINADNAIHEWERQKQGGNWIFVGTTASGVATFRHEGLERLQGYNFRARAVQSGVDNSYLAIGSAKTLAAPNALHMMRR